jgi:hypothetical protein
MYRSDARCHRDACRARFGEHRDGLCPDGSGLAYRAPPRTPRGSTSFSDLEAKVLELMCKAALRGARYEVGPTQAQAVGGILLKANMVRKRISLLAERRKGGV